MTLIYKRLGTPYVGLMTPGLSGEATSDGSAMATMTLTANAGAIENMTVSNNTGFLPGDIVEIAGAGPGGVDDWHTARVLGNTNQSADTTKMSVRQSKPIATSVSGALVTQYHYIDTVYAPNSVTLFNRNTLESFEWKRGQAMNSAIKTSAAGDRSRLASAAIVQTPTGFWFHPNLIGLNSTVEWSVTFEIPAE